MSTDLVKEMIREARGWCINKVKLDGGLSDEIVIIRNLCNELEKGIAADQSRQPEKRQNRKGKQMSACILGAIMYCSGAIHIRGPVGYAPQVMANAWAYPTLYTAPILQPLPTLFPVTRRG